jgi:hypothetical protein
MEPLDILLYLRLKFQGKQSFEKPYINVESWIEIKENKRWAK